MRNLVFRNEGETCVFDKMVPRKTFGATKDEETGEYRRLHNEKINDLYFIAYTLTKEIT